MLALGRDLYVKRLPCMLLFALLCRSFEEMEAQITAGMKTPVLSSRAGPEGSAGDKARKRESEALGQTLNRERDEQVSSLCALCKCKTPKSLICCAGGK